MTAIDYTIIISFMSVMALAGFAISRLIKDSDDIFVAGRELTPFILCATITSTNLSMFQFVGMGGTAYQSGASILWQNWTGDIALVLSALFVVPIFRRLKIRSIPEFLEMRYSKGLRTLIGAFWGVRLCMYLGLLLYIASTAAIVIVGCEKTFANYVLWLLAFSSISILYSAIGGAWAVAIMDSVQFCVMLVGALIILPIATHAAGGMPAVIRHFQSIPHDIHAQLVPATGDFNWLFICAILLLGFKWSTVDQAILQRAFGARTPGMAAKGMVLSAIVTTPFAFFWVLPGLATTQLHHPQFQNPDEAIPWLLANTIPAVAAGLLGIILCGLIAAQISAVTADINSVATLFTSDVYRTLRRKEPSQRTLLFVVRLSSVVCGFLMLTAACLLHYYGGGAVKANLAIVGILDMPLFIVTVIYGLGWKRANWQGAIAGFLIGGLFAVATYYIDLHGVPAKNVAPFVGSITALIVTPLVSLLTSKSSHSTMHIWDAFKVKHNDAEDAFHLIPISAAGRFGFGAVLIGFGAFAIGVLSAHWEFAYASSFAVIGMLTVFGGGLLRVFSE